MKLDKYGNPIFADSDLFNLLYQGTQLDKFSLVVEPSAEVLSLEEVAKVTFHYNTKFDHLSETDFDSVMQSDWLMPKEYFKFDIQAFCLEKCQTQDERQRVLDEFEAFRSLELIPLLQWLKFFVDTCYEHNILWGVGRGSSVSSYVLYLLEVHEIDSLKYNLDWHDFLR